MQSHQLLWQKLLCKINNNDRNNSSNTCIDYLLNVRLSFKCLASSVSFCCKKALIEWILFSSLFCTLNQQTKKEVRVGNSLEVSYRQTAIFSLWFLCFLSAAMESTLKACWDARSSPTCLHFEARYRLLMNTNPSKKYLPKWWKALFLLWGVSGVYVCENAVQSILILKIE